MIETGWCVKVVFGDPVYAAPAWWEEYLLWHHLPRHYLPRHYLPRHYLLWQEEYAFGDVSRAAIAKVSKGVASSFTEFTGKQEYAFGDLSRAAIAKLGGMLSPKPQSSQQPITQPTSDAGTSEGDRLPAIAAGTSEGDRLSDAVGVGGGGIADCTDSDSSGRVRSSQIVGACAAHR